MENIDEAVSLLATLHIAISINKARLFVSDADVGELSSLRKLSACESKIAVSVCSIQLSY